MSYSSTCKLSAKVSIVATMLATGSADPTQASEFCKCSGKSIDSYSGGDGQPLRWSFGANVVDSTSGHEPLLCYFESVANKSAVEVRDVRWEVANYFRSIIAKNSERDACPEIRGSEKDDPTNGPLQFGPSSNGYDTKVRQPKDGWVKEANATPSEVPLTAMPAPQPIITTRLSFNIEKQDGAIDTAELAITSSVTKDDKSTRLEYTLQNDSNLSYYLYVNAATSKELIYKVPFVQNYQKMEPHAKLDYRLSVDDGSNISSAQIIIYDLDKRIVAIDSGGLYIGGAGERVKFRSDKSFWDEIDKEIGR